MLVKIICAYEKRTIHQCDTLNFMFCFHLLLILFHLLYEKQFALVKSFKGVDKEDLELIKQLLKLIT